MKSTTPTSTRALLEQADQERRRGQGQDQVDPDQRLDERERPPAHVVGHLAAEQRDAGEVGRAGAEADADHADQAEHQVRHQRDQHQAAAGEDDREPEQPPPGQVAGHPRAEPHAEPEPDEDRAEQDPVRRVAAAETGRVGLAGADDRAAGRERAEDADDQPADQRRLPDEGPALDAPAAARPGSGAPPAPTGRPLIRRIVCTVSAETRKVSALM